MRLWLRKQREVCGLTQEELAMKVNLSRQMVSAYEKGIRGTSFGALLLKSFAEALGMTIEEAVNAEADYIASIKEAG